MAIVRGTNCGFVTASPSADPGGSTVGLQFRARALKDTAPAGYNLITELGWWCDSATPAADYELGLYDHNAGDDNPENLIEKTAATAKGTDAGWKKVTDLAIPITAGTTYWIAVQLDATTPDTYIDYTGDAGAKMDSLTAVSTLPDPWGASAASSGSLLTVYAVVGNTASSPPKDQAALQKDTIQSQGQPGLFS